MMYSLDRIEDGIAVLIDDNGDSVEVSSSALPEGAKEGDILNESEGVFSLCTDETALRRAEALAMQRKLMNKGK